MQFSQNITDNKATIMLEGEIDLEKTEELREQAMQCLDSNQELEFGMSKVEYIDSSTVSVMIELHQKAEEDSKLFSNSIGLLSETAAAFEKMKIAAQKAGFKIEIVSAYRSFNRQKDIWNRKYRSNEIKGFNPDQNIKKIIEYSTLPGTSRHHWGTEIDIIDEDFSDEENVLMSSKYEKKGIFFEVKQWMNSNSEKFGFYITYNNDPERKGFEYEPWHYSYAPVSKKMLALFLKSDLKKHIKKDEINGSEHFTDEFIEKYKNENILDINPNLK